MEPQSLLLIFRQSRAILIAHIYDKLDEAIKFSYVLILHAWIIELDISIKIESRCYFRYTQFNEYSIQKINGFEVFTLALVKNSLGFLSIFFNLSRFLDRGIFINALD